METPDGYVFPLSIESGLVYMHSIEVPTDDLQKIMQSTLFDVFAVALRVDLQWTCCCLKQSM